MDQSYGFLIKSTSTKHDNLDNFRKRGTPDFDFGALEIHFLRSTLAVHGAPHLETVNQLMGRTVVPPGLVRLEEHKKVTDMSLGEVLQEIAVRGYQTTYTYDPEKPPTANHPAGGTRTISEESYYRECLSGLREKTKGAPIPSKPYRDPGMLLTELGCRLTIALPGHGVGNLAP